MDLSLRVTDNLSQVVNKTTTWTSGEFIKYTINLASGDGAYNIDLSKISNIKFIMISGSSPYTISLTKNAVVSTMDSEDLFVLSPSEVDRSLITDLSIEATNVTSAVYSVQIFGEVE